MSRQRPLEIPTDIAHFKSGFEHWLSFQVMPSGYDEAMEKHVELIPYFAEHAGRGAVWLGIRTNEWLGDRKDKLPGGYPVNIKLRELTRDRTRVTIYAKPDFVPFAAKLDQMIRDTWLAQSATDISAQQAMRDQWPAAGNAPQPIANSRPPKPDRGAPLDQWFAYYHALKSRGQYTLKELAKDKGLSDAYVRQEHAKYNAQHGAANT
jgi:hypothetical protein